MDLVKMYFIQEYPKDWHNLWESYKIRNAIRNLDISAISSSGMKPDMMYMSKSQADAMKAMYKGISGSPKTKVRK